VLGVGADRTCGWLALPDGAGFAGLEVGCVLPEKKMVRCGGGLRCGGEGKYFCGDRARSILHLLPDFLGGLLGVAGLGYFALHLSGGGTFGRYAFGFGRLADDLARC
jgi:hypothetical protein